MRGGPDAWRAAASGPLHQPSTSTWRRRVTCRSPTATPIWPRLSGSSTRAWRRSAEPPTQRSRPMAEDRLNLPFTGLVSFMRVPSCTDLSRIDADIAILGAPTDEGSPWKPGARFAPRKIRELSVKYAGYGPVQSQLGYYDIDENRRFLEYERQYNRIVDCGDSDIIYTNVRRTFDNITRDVRAILDARVFPVVIGGDHAITYPVVRAYQRSEEHTSEL